MMEQNLKGNHFRLSYYRYRPTGESETKNRRVGDSEQLYTKKELERIYLKEEDVRSFSLDKHGQTIPYMDGNITLLSNYILDYWGHFLFAEGIALYMHLKRYCYGELDYCWPDLDLIGKKMHKSRNTLKKYLALLEKYGFVVMFNCINIDKNNMEESPLFKVRKQVPFLPQDLYDGLPNELRVDHDKYMQKLVNLTNHPAELERSLDYSVIYDQALENGTVVRKHRGDQELGEQRESRKRLLEDQQTDKDKALWDSLCELLLTKVSKPSFDTWFKHCLIIRDGLTHTLFCPTPFVTEWIQARYVNMITLFLQEIDAEFKELKVETI
ncbi:DnaA N-terminal domain-containing protein [Paenibacillus enshidis]|uniref:DnaA N-terminal domain-containing protein n=1 Tax=Paenibacillus enshidis TaxID=1458439 RepID=A0ABV5AVF9_9BACL